MISGTVNKELKQAKLKSELNLKVEQLQPKGFV